MHDLVDRGRFNQIFTSSQLSINQIDLNAPVRVLKVSLGVI